LSTVFERVKKVTIAQLGLTENEVTPDSNLAADLGADSLDLVELMMALEEEFSKAGKKITIPDEESEKMLSVQDAVDYLHSVGISDIQVQPRPVEKSGFSRINLPRPSMPHPNISKPGQPRQDRPQDKQQSRPAGASPQRGGQPQQRRDNRPRRDRPQGNAPRPNNPPRPQQQPPPAPQPPPQASQKPPEPGSPAS
jgi:acyl carrier protein